MTTFREIAFMVLDQLKISSDDSYFDIPHVVWLINKYRALLIQRNYNEQKKVIPDWMYQVICLDLELTDDCVKGMEVRSVKQIPNLLSLNDGLKVKILPINSHFKDAEWTFVPSERFAYTGYNKYLKRIIYFTVIDRYLYAKSFNVGYQYLQKVKLMGLFDDPTLANQSEYSCDDIPEGECKDPLDTPVHIEEYLIPPLVEMIIRDLTPQIYRPEDKMNVAADMAPEMVQQGQEAKG